MGPITEEDVKEYFSSLEKLEEQKKILNLKEQEEKFVERAKAVGKIVFSSITGSSSKEVKINHNRPIGKFWTGLANDNSLIDYYPVLDMSNLKRYKFFTDLEKFYLDGKTCYMYHFPSKFLFMEDEEIIEEMKKKLAAKVKKSPDTSKLKEQALAKLSQEEKEALNIK